MKNKVKTIILTLGLALTAHAQQFNGTVFDLDSGRIQVISGSMSEDNSISSMSQRTIDSYRRMNAELEASLANMRQEEELQKQTYQLREQTELLRKILNQ